jgi:hypothetical protein
MLLKYLNPECEQRIDEDTARANSRQLNVV